MRDQRRPEELPRLDVSGYLGEWIALDPETYAVVAHDRSLQTVRDQAREKGVDRPLLYRAPESKAAILGQIGFFAFFTVTFRYVRKQIEIRRSRP